MHRHDKHPEIRPLPTMESPDRFINRELSWLAFNERVMGEALNPKNPLLERMKFLSISAGNLDEFMMVRVAGLMDQVRHDVESKSDDGYSPVEQLKRIQQAMTTLMLRQQQGWLALKKELWARKIQIISAMDLKEREREWLSEHFLDNIFPALTPIAVDPSHPFPFLANQSISLLFEMRKVRTGKPQVAVLPLPSKLPRFIRLNGKAERYIQLEDVIRLHIDSLFPGFELMESALFRIIRDSDLEIEEEAEDLVRYYENAIKQRRRGRVIRIKVLKGTNTSLIDFFAEQVHAESSTVMEVEGMIGLSSLSELYQMPVPELKYPPYSPRFPERITDYNGDCFSAIQAKDIIIHHPFESFDVVVQFLRQAAADPQVISIKQTLYRTSQDSPIVKALIEAAENGKSVTALVELKARFDEEANIKWARDMERAGVQVVYGFVHLKTHAKLSLVVRRDQSKLRSYAHLGTGNYHPMTAKVYTDLSFFTSDESICRDVTYLFNYITGYAEPRAFDKLIVAPLMMRKSVLELIEKETAFAKEGKPASIWAKMNALVDKEIIDALYRASQAGVKIEIIARGICCLRPGIPGLSENIRVKSLIGRFLEHSRIFAFGNGHPLPSPEAKVYISSADWMHRNFDRRVEVMVPIENPTVHAQVLDQIMVAELRDEAQSWTLDKEGHYIRHQPEGEGFSAHTYFMTNPSLSGRGKALRKNKKQLSRLKTLTKDAKETPKKEHKGS